MAIQKIETLKAMKIGVDNVVACRIDDTELSYTPTSEVIALPGAMALNVNANFSMETAFYDNGPGEVASSLGVIETTFNKSALGPKEKAWLLGLNLDDSSGEVTYSQNNVSPWIALGFRSLRSDGTYTYTWLLKGKFTLPEDNNETKADTINFQSEELTGRFVTTNFAFPIKDENSKESKGKLWKIDMSEAYVAEISDETTKASAELQIQGWEYLLNSIEKSTEGKNFKSPSTVKVKDSQGNEIGQTGLEIEAAARTEIFQVFGFAEPANSQADDTCIQAFEYWECKSSTDPSPLGTTDTKSFNYKGNGRFQFVEQSASVPVTAYIACKAVFGGEDARNIIKVTGKQSSRKSVDSHVEK